MQVSFDIDDFLAYLLTGCIMLVSLVHFSPNFLDQFLSPSPATKGSNLPFVSTIAIAAIILILGHLSSVVTRAISRPLLHIIIFNPREKVFNTANDEFWDRPFKKRIYENFEKVFGYTVSDEEKSKAAPRLIRSYVLNHYPATREIRDRIVRARSLCSNTVLPITLLSFACFKIGHALTGVSLLFLALAMLWKQHDLDNREWKEIYTAFVNIDHINKG